MGNFLADFRFRVCLQFTENHACDFLRGVGFCFAGDFDLDVGVTIGSSDDLVGHALVGIGEFGKFPTDEALGGEDGVLRVGDGLAFRGLADEALTVFREGDNGWGGAGTFRVFKNGGFAAVHDGHTRVGGAEVDS